MATSIGSLPCVLRSEASDPPTWELAVGPAVLRACGGDVAALARLLETPPAA